MIHLITNIICGGRHGVPEQVRNRWEGRNHFLWEKGRQFRNKIMEIASIWNTALDSFSRFSRSYDELSPGATARNPVMTNSPGGIAIHHPSRPPSQAPQGKIIA